MHLLSLLAHTSSGKFTRKYAIGGGCFVRLHIQYQSFDLFEITRAPAIAGVYAAITLSPPPPPFFSRQRERIAGNSAEKNIRRVHRRDYQFPCVWPCVFKLLKHIVSMHGDSWAFKRGQFLASRLIIWKRRLAGFSSSDPDQAYTTAPTCFLSILFA